MTILQILSGVMIVFGLVVLVMAVTTSISGVSGMGLALVIGGVALLAIVNWMERMEEHVQSETAILEEIRDILKKD